MIEVLIYGSNALGKGFSCVATISSQEDLRRLKKEVFYAFSEKCEVLIKAHFGPHDYRYVCEWNPFFRSWRDYLGFTQTMKPLSLLED